MDLNTLSVCSGIGGLELGIQLVIPGLRVIAYVENEAYSCEILAERMEEGILAQAAIYSDVRTFRSSPWAGLVHCIIGGYPCQGFSISGEQRGSDDPRYLWPYVANLVSELRPGLCFFENVENHIRLGLPQVVDDLEQLGYAVETGLFSNEIVGAPQVRKRVFILAHARGQGLAQPELSHPPRALEGGAPSGPAQQRSGPPVAYFPPGRDPGLFEWHAVWEWQSHLWPNTEPVLRGMADGVPDGLGVLRDRVFRVQTVGNSVSPAVGGLAFAILAQRAGILS